MARRRQDGGKGSWTELFLFVMIIACIYFMLALFDSSLTGEGGREWGKYLRNTWGGAVIVLLLFLMYVCIAKLMRFRIPRLPRQILGTVQLYISFAFMLGFLNEMGWESERTLFRPGSFGSGLAKFFVLNIGTFITLLLVAGSFVLSAVFYGSRILRLTMPSLPSFRLRRRKPKPRRREREDYEPATPESILFTDSIPSPKLKPVTNEDDEYAQIEPPEIEMPTNLRPAPEIQLPDMKPAPKLRTGQKAIEIIDDALAMIDAGTTETPRRKAPAAPSRPRKVRRPLPEITFPDGTATPEPEPQKPQARSRRDEAVFPPPPEIFGERSRFDASRIVQRDSEKQGRTIITTLKNFGINAEVAQTTAGPSVVQYKLELAPGTKISKISGLDEEIAMDLAVMTVRIEAPILGTHYVGVEVPVSERKTVTLRSLIESGEFINTSARLPLPLGVRTGGRVMVKGLDDMPHLLAAGGEGSGRSTFVNTCIVSLCSVKTPDELKLLLISPGHSEFSEYEKLPHLLASPVNTIDTARKALEWACSEMDKRTADFAQEKAKNIDAYNRKVPKPRRIPEIVIVINELSDLVYAADNDFSSLIIKLARKSGGAGIHMIVSAQKPSVDILPSIMKSVFPARAVFTLSAAADSRNIIDTADASRLTGKGDMLFISTNSPVPVRLQAPYIGTDKIADFVEYMSTSLEPPALMTF